MPRFTKADIQFHYDHERRPAVNVKVYDSLATGMRQFREDNPDADARYTVEWIEAHVSDEAQSEWFYAACEIGFERAQSDAEEVFGSRIYGQDVKVYAEGRSGGWAVVHGIDNDVESWDAIRVTQWGRWARMVRAEADYTMALVCDLIYYNRFESWKDEESERIGGEAFAPERMFSNTQIGG